MDMKSFKTIAHRGASHYYPENTLVSFNAGIAMGADMIEFDVSLTSDDVPVVIHDDTVDRTTNGTGKISDFTLDEILELDAGSWLDKKFSGEKIPTLDELFEECAGRIPMNIEIKTEAVRDDYAGGVEELCCSLIEKYQIQDDIMFSSFDPRAIVHLNVLAPHIPRAILYHAPLWGTYLPSDIIVKCGADAFNCSYDELTPQWIHDLKMHHIPVHIYTVNEPDKMQRLVTLGVTGIFTNCPDVLKKLLTV